VLEPGGKVLAIAIDNPDKDYKEQDLRDLFGSKLLLSSLERVTLNHIGHDHSAWK
jgi:hypothetical protein